jgi:hypothetical protein
MPQAYGALVTEVFIASTFERKLTIRSINKPNNMSLSVLTEAHPIHLHILVLGHNLETTAAEGALRVTRLCILATGVGEEGGRGLNRKAQKN